jgi:mannose-1-phosphate guanylyltransferase / phosphomannomutase
MKAMILAAGLGVRLRPMTEKIPKALVSVAGRPMIEYPLMLLKHYGISDIIINLYHLGHRIEEHLGDGSKLGLRICYSHEEKLMDTGGAILQAKAFLEDGTFVVINTDVMIDLNFEEVLAYHRKKRSLATLVLRQDEQVDRYGAIASASDGRIKRFLQWQLPCNPGESLEKQMFTGVQILEPAVFNFMKESGPFSLTRTTYPQLLMNEEPLYGFSFNGTWEDLGTIETIRKAEEKLAFGEVKLHYQ